MKLSGEASFVRKKIIFPFSFVIFHWSEPVAHVFPGIAGPFVKLP